MSVAAFLAALVPATTLVAATPAQTYPPPRVEVVTEITSYGERPRDLLALLVPFFAKRQFYQRQRPLPELPAEGSAAFRHPGGDFVVTSGRFNCIVVVYYSLTPWIGIGGDPPRERAGAFQFALLDFLESLPTPRPALRSVSFGSRNCGNAT